MKNPEIELVKKWLTDPKSVSSEDRERAVAATDTAAASAANAKGYAVFYAAVAAFYAAAAAVRDDTVRAKYWVEKYEELTNG